MGGRRRHHASAAITVWALRAGRRPKDLDEEGRWRRRWWQTIALGKSLPGKFCFQGSPFVVTHLAIPVFVKTLADPIFEIRNPAFHGVGGRAHALGA
jgi:hypothetical protein